MSMILQETFDRFLLHLQNQEGTTPDKISQAEQTFSQLSEYLIYYSDLFQAEEFEDDSNPADWEESLEGFVEQLIAGNQDNTPSLEELPLDKVSGEYFRDFIGWHLLREAHVNSLMVESSAETLLAWLTFVYEAGWIELEQFQHDTDIVKDIFPDAKRAAIAGHLLLHHIRLGGSVSPRLRGKRFEIFKEGHARISNIEGGDLWLSFDTEPKDLIGPVALPEIMLQQLRVGDVMDVELGKRSDVWNIVDIGPVYPAAIYVEAEELDLPQKLT